jgi:hypothetical protein
MEKSVMYPKGMKLFCSVCDKHVFTLQVNLHLWDTLSEAAFDPKEGQGPWLMDQRMACRNCGAAFFAKTHFIGRMEFNKEVSNEGVDAGSNEQHRADSEGECGDEGLGQSSIVGVPV